MVPVQGRTGTGTGTGTGSVRTTMLLVVVLPDSCIFCLS
jgi:hypothetical protein